jgi:hypothetical protein
MTPLEHVSTCLNYLKVKPPPEATKSTSRPVKLRSTIVAVPKPASPKQHVKQPVKAAKAAKRSVFDRLGDNPGKKPRAILI